MGTGQFRMLRCSIAGVEAVSARSRHSFPRHTHDRFGIGVIDCGAHRSLSGRGMVEAGPGDTITVNPGEVHDGMPIGDGGRSWRMLYIDPSLVADILRDMSEGRTAEIEPKLAIGRRACTEGRWAAGSAASPATSGR